MIYYRTIYDYSEPIFGSCFRSVEIGTYPVDSTQEEKINLFIKHYDSKEYNVVSPNLKVLEAGDVTVIGVTSEHIRESFENSENGGVVPLPLRFKDGIISREESIPC